VNTLRRSSFNTRGRVICAVVFVCLATMFSHLTAYAGPWPTPIGKGQIISTTLTDHANKAYDEDGDLSLGVEFAKFDTGLFWEHGLSKDITVVLHSSLQDINFSSGVDQAEFKGLGESGIGLRHVLWQDERSVLSTQMSVIFPSSGETISDADLGFGATNFEMRVLAGRSFKFAQKDGFVDVQAAWRLRPSDNPDEYRVDGTVGWRPKENIQVLAQGFYAQGNGKFGIARQNSRLKLQTSLVYDKTPKTSYQIGVYQTVAGRNIVKEKALFFGVWQRY